MSQRRRASPSPSAPTGPSGVSSIHGKEDRSYFHDSPAPNSSTLIRALVHRLQSPQTWRHPRRRSTFGMGDEIAMAVKIDRIQPAGVNVRRQQGKPAHSHVVAVTGPAKMIYIAGQLARDADGNIVGPGDMRAQLEQTFKNLEACLKAAGATWADVVKTNTFVTDYQAFSQCSDVRMRYFGVGSPTSTTIQISGLAQPEAMVEIEMIAAVE